MTLADALAIAAQAKPHRQQFDKLQRTNAAAQLSARADALRKSFDVLGSAISNMQARLDQLEEAVSYMRDYTPGQPLWRFHS